MPTAAVEYSLPPGSFALYPPLAILTQNPPPHTYPFAPTRPWTTMLDCIQYYTSASLFCESFQTIGSLRIMGSDTQEDPVRIVIGCDGTEEGKVSAFGRQHYAFLEAATLARSGADKMRETPAWNPMAGYPVNKSDGPCEWLLFLPLGMAMLLQKAVVLMHYPPIIAMKNADYLHNNTLSRWQNLLTCAGNYGPNFYAYTTIVDVNPIAAPGSGQSEYPNDYFPIMMTSLFFQSYVLKMVGTLLRAGQNLPLMVCGSPAYDPQAAGWFRVAYKSQMPKDSVGTPQANVLQTGSVALEPGAPLTQYIVANHMIAGGVCGRNTGLDWSNSANLPDIRQYEAQDLSATSALLSMGQGISPDQARAQACQRWYGTPNVPSPASGIPVPPSDDDKALLCAMGLVDLYFNVQTVQPYYTLAQAQVIVAAARQQYPPNPYPPYPKCFNPCDTTVFPPPHGDEAERSTLVSA